jgi:23S rRNA pseudouridine1911/1915/1917 synthase
MTEKSVENSPELEEDSILEARVEPALSGQRLDQVAATLFPEFSRSRLQGWIRDGNLTVDGHSAKAKDKMLGGELLHLEVVLEEHDHWEAEPVDLDIVYEDDQIIVINKPVGLVVHPGAGNHGGTMLNGLLHYCPSLNQVPRAGIVHRIDKDTSGLLVVAKTRESHLDLVEQLREKSVSRVYLAVVHGVVTAGGTVDQPIGRHPVHRTRRAVSRSNDAREAVTHYRVLEKFRSHTLVQCELETGRTHQIRVHMTYLGFPLVGDQLYGGRPRIPKGASPELIDFLDHFKRQALHAWQLGLVHPATGEEMQWEAGIPEDMQTLIRLLEEDNV